MLEIPLDYYIIFEPLFNNHNNNNIHWNLFRENGINAEGARYIADSLRELKNLTKLKLNLL